MRKPPTVPSPQEIKRRADANLVKQVRKYELITPLFGGGVEPGFADPVTIIRGASIRGQLRFWWRACRGGEFNGNLSRMKDAEDSLWGAASMGKDSKPSRVQITVEVDENTRSERFVAHGQRGNEVPVHDPNSPYGYVAFPLRDKPNNGTLKSVKFSLKISFPKDALTDIEATLWAWETFGGIGARTRRGFGALRLVSVDNTPATALPANAQAIERAITQHLTTHVSAGIWPDGVPHLSRSLAFKVTERQPDAIGVWRKLIAALKQFRQQRNSGAASNRPGRSKWPEPDAIRRLTSSAPMYAISVSSVDKFPRAAFGLPIIFKFKDDGSGDPPKTTLKGVNSERLASPLILRPLACGNGEAVGLAIVLDSPIIPPGGLLLEGVPAKGSTPANPPIQSCVTPAEAASIVPLNNPPPTQCDVLRAFLRTL